MLGMLINMIIHLIQKHIMKLLDLKFGSKPKKKITHLVVGVGTGGTISGIAKYLKEKNSDIQIWGIDTYGSVLRNITRPEILIKMKFILILQRE